MSDRVDLGDVFDESFFKKVISLNNKIVKSNEGIAASIDILAKSYSQLESQLGKNESQLKNLQKELKKTSNEGVSNLAAETDKYTAENKELNSQLELLRKELDELKKTQDKLNEVHRKGNKTISEKTKLKNKLKQITSEENKELVKLKIQIAQANKEVRDSIKNSPKELDAYQKKSKRLNELRKEYKNLAASQEKSSKSTDKLKREISQLDKELKEIDADVGQFQRNVGNYEKAVEGLKKQLNTISATNAIAAIGSIGNLLKNSADNAGDTTVAYEQLQAALDVLKGEAAEFSKSLIDGVLDLKNNIKDLIGLSTEAEKREREFQKFRDELAAKNKKDKEGGDLGIDQKIERALKNQEALTKARLKFQRELLGVQKDGLKVEGGLLEQLSKEEGILQDIEIRRDSENVSLKDRQSLAIQAQKQEEVIAQKRVQIIQKELELLLEANKIKRESGLVDTDLLEAVGAKRLELIDAEIEANNRQLEAAKENITLRDDIIEQQLDLLIDGADNIKAINERIIADERLTIEEREALLLKNTEIVERSVAKQIEVLQKAAKKPIDINALLAISDPEKLDKSIRSLGLSERLTNRQREVIIEYRNALQDLNETEKELNETRFNITQQKENIKIQETELSLIKEKNKELLLLQSINEDDDLEGRLKQLEEFDKTFNKIEEDSNIKRLESERDLLSKEIELIKDNSEKEIELKEELNDILIQLEKEKYDIELETQKTALEQKIKANKDALDEQKKQEEEAREFREKIFNSPIADAANQALIQEIENKVLLAGIEAFLNSIKQGGTAQEAASEGVQAIAAAQIIKSLSNGFHDGGYTGNGHEWDIAGVTHKGEFVNTAKQTHDYGMVGWTAKDFDKAIETGHFNQFAKTNKFISDSMGTSLITTQINNVIDYEKLSKVLADNIPETDISWYYDHLQYTKKTSKYSKSTTYKDKATYIKPSPW